MNLLKKKFICCLATLPSILWLSMSGHKKQCSANISLFPFSFEKQSKSGLLLGGLCAIVFFYETTDIWLWKNFCCEILLAFWVLWTLRAWMTGRLFSWDLHTSSGWGWRQLKSNIGFLVPTKNCPSEKFIYFRPKTQNQHTFKPTIKRILLYTLHQMHIFVQLKRYICISEHRGLKSWGFSAVVISHWGRWLMLFFGISYVKGKKLTKWTLATELRSRWIHNFWCEMRDSRRMLLLRYLFLLCLSMHK